MGAVRFIFSIFSGTLCLFAINRQQSKRDFAFQLADEVGLWQTRLAARFQSTPKKLTNGNKIAYTYQRFFPKFRQQAFIGLVNEPRHHVHLRLEQTGQVFEWRETDAALYQKERKWKLITDGRLVASAILKPTIQSVVALETRLAVTIGNEAYQITGYKGSSQILLERNGQLFGEGDFSKLVNGHYQFRIPDDAHDNLLAMAMTLFVFMKA